ncbi:amino acid adenylation domain-containing protein [Streptomyces sp. DSM 40750]|uniref:amino acid adenylation domain-containing protein n=1 Tax=Streptomyces sp. DSM 40750 TaxID=2801030 RepID=UPI00214C10EE|nr:amino acid adenylation domain-containing protein [Streptomyces sp. DSM 40750]UUU25938.1 amino acid adenylation domain-containing protein [Streptomyces sp. DSM 40750]
MSATLDQLICRHAETSPEAIAVADPDGSITYGQLVDRARRVAEVLRARGMETESPVGVLVPRSCDYAVAVLGVMIAGCAFVPLDPEYPLVRLTGALRDSGAVGLICRKDTESLLPFDGELIRLDSIGGDGVPAVERREAPSANPRSWVGFAPDDANRLACILYTSGSTGKPKGVALPHRALVNHFLWEAEFLGVGPADRIAQRAPSGFDAALWEMAVALLSGATLVVVPTDVATITSVFRDYANARGITLMLAVPTLLQAYLESGVLREVPSMRTVVSCGEALNRSLAESIKSETGARLVNVYGPTEGGVGAMEFSVDTEVVSATVPIGKPAGNVTIYVLDDRLMPAGAGDVGEVYIAGPQLARGYFNAPAQTSERFVADHISGVPGARMYRTGDLARMLPSGDLEYLGRGDGQFKLHGVRVETAEVEAVLAECPGVSAAAVAVRSVSAGTSILVAYVVALPEAGEGLVARLYEFLQDRLHGAMIPARCVLVDRLPLLPNGKVDRASLPEVAARSGMPVKSTS